MIYLDNAATTCPRSEVLEAMSGANATAWANPSSRHALGEKSSLALAESRRQIASILGVQAEEIIFTSGGTEADNLAILGVIAARRTARRVLVSAVEHQAVLRAADKLGGQGITVEQLPVNADCVVSPDVLRAALKRPADLVSVMWVNNEVGSIQPIAELARIAREAGALFHSDAVQALGKVEVNASCVDLLTLSAHKIHGPKGVGALFVRRGTTMRPILLGGGQEVGLRSGTENVPGVAGFAAAARMADPSEAQRVAALRDELEERILATCPGAFVNAAGANRACHISNISFPMVSNNYLLNRLAHEGVCVTAGSACHSRSLEPSHVLVAMGRSAHDAQSAIRFSLSTFTTRDEILSAAATVRSIVREFSVLI